MSSVFDYFGSLSTHTNGLVSLIRFGRFVFNRSEGVS